MSVMDESYCAFMDESYCAFCGVCFGVDSNLYDGRLMDDDTAWTDYFVARS